MTRDRDVAREPCPDRIVEDLGGAFGMGCVGGWFWHFIKGARNSPRGEVMAGGLYSAKMRAPILGGNFAVWGGTFSSFDCTFQYLRGKEDHWNAIASGFCTGGVLALRGGWRSATRNAVIGGVLLGIIEMVSAVLTRKTTPTPRHQFQQQLEYEKMLQEMEQKQKAAANATGGSSTPSSGSFFSTSPFFSSSNSKTDSSSSWTNFFKSQSEPISSKSYSSSTEFLPDGAGETAPLSIYSSDNTQHLSGMMNDIGVGNKFNDGTGASFSTEYGEETSENTKKSRWF